jgi:hypothetical protein
LNVSNHSALFWYFWSGLATIVAMTATIILNQKRKQHLETPIVEGLLASVESGDAGAYQALIEKYGDRNPYWWPSVVPTKLKWRVTEVFAAYLRQQKYAEYDKNFTALATTYNNLEADPNDRIEALLEALRLLKKLGIEEREIRDELVDQLSSRDVLKAKLQQIVSDLVLKLAVEAETSLFAFWRLYHLRNNLKGRHLRRATAFRRFNFSGSGIKWVEPVEWQFLVDRWIDHPNIRDFGLKNNMDPVRFTDRIVQALQTQDRLQAKIARAFLVKNPRLRAVITPQSIDAIYRLAGSGLRAHELDFRSLPAAPEPNPTPPEPPTGQPQPPADQV